MSKSAAASFWEEREASTPAWREKRKLAAALRDLAARCVTTDAPEATLAEAASTVSAITASLAEHPARTFKDGWSSCKTHDDYALFIDRSPITGHSNPYAPPMRLHSEGETAVARVTFGPTYEGMPGCVHGGLVSAAFDQVFGYLMTNANEPAVTGSLSVRYLKPTPLGVELRLEARTERVEGKRHHLRARLFAGDQIHAEAEAVFVIWGHARLESVVAAEKAKKPAQGKG